MDINGPIERDIPLPRAGRKGPAPTYLIDDMEPGDSRLFMAHPKRVRPAVWPRAKALGFVLRSASEGENTRVWRLS